MKGMERWLLVALLISLLLRIPSLFEPQLYGDEGIYLSVGMGLRQGLTLYSEVYDNKPPLIYLLAAAAGTVFWFRLLLIAWNLLSIAVFWELAAKFLTKEKLVAGATMFFALLTSIPIFEGQIVNAEILMILPTLVAWWLTFSETRNPDMKWIWVGVMVGIATLFKAPAALDLAAIAAARMILRKDMAGWLREVLRTGVGFGGILLASFLFMAAQGAGIAYVRSAFLETLSYTTTWGDNPGTGMAIRVILLVIGFLGVWRFREKLGKQVYLFLWLIFTLFAATISARPYPHYLVQALPPVAIFLAIGALGDKKSSRQGWLGVLVFAIVIVLIRFWRYPVASYYGQFLGWISGQYSREEYAQLTEPKMKWLPELVSTIRGTTSRADEIFVWGDEPAIYYLSGRRPSSRFVVAYHVRSLNAYDEVAKKLSGGAPEIIVVIDDERTYPALERILATKYVPAGTYGEARIFRKVGDGGLL